MGALLFISILKIHIQSISMRQKYFFVFLLLVLFNTSSFADKVLVTIGKSGQVTERQLETAMQAAPFATQFPSMDEDDQAYLRGDMLLRLARAEALYQESESVGKKQSQLFLKEMSNFKTALLAQRYQSHLRQQFKIPVEVEQQFAEQTQGNSDALAAARSAYVARHFARVKKEKIAELIQQAGVKSYFSQLNDNPESELILAEGQGVLIKYADLVSDKQAFKPEKQQIIEKVNEWIAMILSARAAEAEGINIASQLKDYERNLAIRLLLAEQEQSWISDESVLRDYFQQNPHIAYIPERRQIGQIVLPSETEAKAIRERIMAGESLFELAAQYSIDPYGRQRSGDMGWLTEGSGSEQIEQALKLLKDNEISEIVKTDKGWHLITIVNRKPSERKNFAAIKDRVRQKFIAEKMTDYLQQVTNKYPLQWHIDEHIKFKETL